jgi:regulator of sirC expression with transglutaminase-like and TPR domain
LPDNSEIKSLVYLLEDPETHIRSAVINRLRDIGEQAVPLIDQARSRLPEGSLRELHTSVLRDITFGSFQQEVVELAESGIFTLEDLEDAVFMFSRFDNPTIRMRPYSELLDSMADEVFYRIHKADSDRKKMLALLQFVFSQYGFSGCGENYLDPRHSYLHHVLTERKGIPLSLSFVVLFLARRLQLPFTGVNMPLHFLLKFTTADNDQILIDPFNQGSIIKREQCNRFLKKNGIKAQDQYYDNAQPYAMFTRFVRNLINGHKEFDEPHKAAMLSKLLGLFETSSVNP